MVWAQVPALSRAVPQDRNKLKSMEILKRYNKAIHFSDFRALF
jgi:hypothetical protein